MGKLFLIPSPIGENPVREVIPEQTLAAISSISTFVVEETRTARRYLSAAGLKGHIEELEFHELNEHSTEKDADELMKLFNDGRDVGLISEAGLPAVADPGALLVERCHTAGIDVVPMIGPSSLMLALMASGLNGQSFAFCGYLPVKTEERKTALKAAEKRSSTLSQTQIFIETPYRNDSLFADMLQSLKSDTKICIAANITCSDQFIRTRTASGWKSNKPTIGKRPCVFLILA